MEKNSCHSLVTLLPIHCAQGWSIKLAITHYGMPVGYEPSSTITLWRGSLLPLGCAAVVNPVHAVCLKKTSVADFWGLLRSPTGASPLATGKPPHHKQAPSP